MVCVLMQYLYIFVGSRRVRYEHHPPICNGQRICTVEKGAVNATRAQLCLKASRCKNGRGGGLCLGNKSHVNYTNGEGQSDGLKRRLFDFLGFLTGFLSFPSLSSAARRL